MLRGDGGTRSTRSHAVRAARGSFVLSNPRYRSQLTGSAAGVVVVGESDADGLDRTLLVARDPYVAFARIAALFDPPRAPRPGVHASAVVGSGAKVDPSAEIGPFVVIGERSVVGAGAIIGAGCVIGEDCLVGAGSPLVARVTWCAACDGQDSAC